MKDGSLNTKNMTQEFIHSFKGFGKIPSSVRVKIFSDDGENFILFEDIDDGTSVTNVSEQLASEIIEREGFSPDSCRFFETYSQYDYDSVDEIKYNWLMKKDPNKWIAEHPQWSPAEPEIREMFEL